MKKIKNIIQQLRNIFTKINIYVILGFFITIIIFYYRFIRERVTGELDSTYTTVKVIFFIILIIFFFIRINYAIIMPFYNNAMIIEYRKLGKDSLQKTKIYILLQYYNKFIEYPKESFFSFILDPLILYFEEFFFLFFLEKALIVDKYLDKFITIFYSLPPAIISFIFLLETSYYKEYTYFSYSILLMIFPLMVKMFIYILKYLCFLVEKHVFSKILKEFSREKDIITYIWNEEAYLYIPKDYQTDEELLEQVTKYHKHKSFLKIFEYWDFFVFASKKRYYLRIFTLICFFLSFCFKLGLLH